MNNTTPQLRFCKTGNHWLPLTDFSKKRNGYQSKCKEHAAEYAREYYKKNTEAQKERVKARNKRVRAEMRSLVKAARSGKVCEARLSPSCTGDVDLVVVGADPPVSKLIVNEQREQLVETLACARWVCRTCAGALHYRKRETGTLTLPVPAAPHEDPPARPDSAAVDVAADSPVAVMPDADSPGGAAR